jgi:thiamine pyrophosphokinase
MSRAVIFVNGRLPDLESARRLIHPGDTILAADGGTRHLLALGLSASIIIGDLDSLTEEEQHSREITGCKVIKYPHDKNETDLELALLFAIEAGHREILIIGALGGRLDQTLGNLSLLTGPEFAGLELRVDDGVEETWFVRNRCEVRGNPGDIVSLVPWGGEVAGVTTNGLRWPLCDESLYPDKTRGISNEMLGETASISLKSGLLLVIHLHNNNHKS